MKTVSLLSIFAPCLTANLMKRARLSEQFHTQTTETGCSKYVKNIQPYREALQQRKIHFNDFPDNSNNHP